MVVVLFGLFCSLLSISVASTEEYRDCNITTIDELADALSNPDLLVTAGEADTEDRYRYQGWFYFINVPLFYVYVSTYEDAQLTLNFAICNNLTFSVRSGGHSFGDFSSVKDGVVIDVSHLNDLEIVERFGKAYLIAGSGSNMSRIYDFLSANNSYYAPLGLCADVGIGGFAQGGGHTFWSRSDGLMIDFVRGAKVLLASGEIVDVNRFQNPALLYALRGGGGGNWGIVLQYTIELIPAVPFVTSIFSFAPDFQQFPNMTYNFMQITRNYFTDPINIPLANNFNLYFNLGPNSISFSLVWVSDSHQPSDVQDGVDFLQQFQDSILASVDAIYGTNVIVPTNRNISVVDVAGFFDSLGGLGAFDGVFFSATITAKLLPSVDSFNDEFLLALNDYLVAEYAGPAQPRFSNTFLSFELLGGKALTNDRFSLRTSYPNREFLISTFLINGYFFDPEGQTEIPSEDIAFKDSKIQDWRDLYNLTGSTQSYINYLEPDYDLSDNFYGGFKNQLIFKVLQRIKQRYDPNNYFTFPLAIPLPE